MSSTEKADAPIVDQPAQKPKPVKEKKPKRAKTASHPPYFQMIKDALLALNEKGGSSPYAIAKYMEEKHKTELPRNFRKILTLQLKNQAAKGKLIKVKASYRLSDEEGTAKVAKSTTEKEKKQQRPKQSEATTAKLSKKTEAAKKKGGVKKTMKSSPAKPKQPKSIKSPAKRARKSAA